MKHLIHCTFSGGLSFY